jgi:hypothetical protein
MQNPSTVVNEVIFWGLAVGVIALVMFWERRPLRSIGGCVLSCKDSLFSLLFGVLLFTLISILSIIVAHMSGATAQSPEVLVNWLSSQYLFASLWLSGQG